MVTNATYAPFYQSGPSQQQMMAEALMNQNMQNQATGQGGPVSPSSGLNQVASQIGGGLKQQMMYGLGQQQNPGQNLSPQTNPGPPGSIPVGATNLGPAMPWLGS